MTKATDNRGGARKGAGRKPSPIKHKTMTLWVSEETFLQAQALRKAGVKVNEELAYEVRRLFDLCITDLHYTNY